MSKRRAPRQPPATADQRTPDERLEALVREPNRERALRMLMRIRQGLDEQPDPAPWLAAARTLSERLLISEDAWYYFVEIFTECLLLGASASDEELMRLRAGMDAIERAYGLRAGQYWLATDAPPEWRVLNDAWNARADVITVGALRDAGHADLADSRERNLAEFNRRAAKGRVELFGDDD